MQRRPPCLVKVHRLNGSLPLLLLVSVLAIVHCRRCILHVSCLQTCNVYIHTSPWACITCMLFHIYHILYHKFHPLVHIYKFTKSDLDITASLDQSSSIETLNPMCAGRLHSRPDCSYGLCRRARFECLVWSDAVADPPHGEDLDDRGTPSPVKMGTRCYHWSFIWGWCICHSWVPHSLACSLPEEAFQGECQKRMIMSK